MNADGHPTISSATAARVSVSTGPRSSAHIPLAEEHHDVIHYEPNSTVSMSFKSAIKMSLLGHINHKPLL